MSPQDILHWKLSKEDRGHKQYKGRYKIGEAYTINNQVYHPEKPSLQYNQTGLASWYGKENHLHGHKTANGDRYNKNLLTAAHRTLPMPSMIKVTNLQNNKSLIVMVNDRGPFSRNRIVDVSEQAASILEFKKQGVAKVLVEFLEKESKELLIKLALEARDGAVTKKRMQIPRCSVNCHIKLVNIERKLPITPEKK
jgi:rare lipoprotein A